MNVQSSTSSIGEKMKYYAKSHAWAELKDGVATIGISSFAADEMSELTYVELPEIGKTFQAGEAISSVESVKAAEMVYAPVGGKVCEVNAALETKPEIINKDAEGDGWICRLVDVNESALEELLTQDEYLKSVK